MTSHCLRIFSLYFAVIMNFPVLAAVKSIYAHHEPLSYPCPEIMINDLSPMTSIVTFVKSTLASTSSGAMPYLTDFPPVNITFFILFAIFTVTLHFALTPLPSAAVAVISAVPFATAVTVPFALTVAILESELLQVIFLFAALSGFTVAVRLAV